MRWSRICGSVAMQPYFSSRETISQEEMRRLFNEGLYWERTQSGELEAVLVKTGKHPTREKARQPFCTKSQTLSYRDQDGLEVAKVHQYLRPDNSIGGRGKPDPKKLLVGDILFVLPQSATHLENDP